MEVSGQLEVPAALPPEKGPRYPLCIGGLVDLRAGLDGVENRKFLTLPGLEIQHLGRPVGARGSVVG
jgi:hypothetical protein